MKKKNISNNTLAAIFCVAVFVGCGQEDNINATEEKRTWTSPGGTATVIYDEAEPFMKVSTAIDENEIATVSQGRELFIAHWFPAPSSRSTLDGLGPLYNANACSSCHISDGRVAPYKNNGELDQSFLFRIGNESGEAHPIYGGQLQTQSTVGVPEVTIKWVQNSVTSKIDFLTTPDLSTESYNLGPRIAPHLVGMGLLNLVTEDTILEYADPDDLNKDGVSGRAHWVLEENKYHIGKFGWKAINSTLRTQNSGAMYQDMGLTSPVHPNENCTSEQEICSSEANGGSPEVSEESLMSIVNFMTALGVPQRRIENQNIFDEGAHIFESIGCASCHRSTMVTGVSNKFKSLSRQTIYPYTDLLLHDMGDGLSDGVKEKDATAREWRTPPLWGIGIVEQKAGSRFLHDGRAVNLQEAIEQHGGEAQQARDKFIQLDSAQLKSLMQFLHGI